MMPQTTARMKNVANASHSIGSEPWKVVVPFTVATTPRMRISVDSRNSTSRRKFFSGMSQRNPHAPVGIIIPITPANVHAIIEKSTLGKA